jgi:hypothetical protein
VGQRAAYQRTPAPFDFQAAIRDDPRAVPMPGVPVPGVPVPGVPVPDWLRLPGVDP